MTIAIIGAGMAGLSCAQHLRAAGHEVTLFDKGRGPGGRMASRRHDGGRIDHGAQYFTAHDPRFRAQVEAWISAGAVSPWATPLHQWTEQGIAVEDSGQRYLGLPRMSACIAAAAEGLSVHWAVRVEACVGGPGAWRLRSDAGNEYGPFAAVVVAVPSVQAVALLTALPALQAAVAACVVDPCWSTLLWLEHELPTPWSALSLQGHPQLSWCAWEHHKPGRDEGPRLIVHASPEWSRRHLEEPAEWVGEQLRSSVATLLGSDGPLPLVDSQVHRWRYARVREALSAAMPRFDVEHGLGVAGDWCRGPRIEEAWLSGCEVATAINAALSPQAS